MFWGVILESGKRYSQKVSESYHLSMACLEALPGNTKPAKKQVYVMVEHGETEYILCVLEYGRIVQQRLDVIFDCGEVVTYFLNGEGVVHLTGYALAELKDENAISECTVLPALKASNEDEDDEEDEDWTPSKEQRDSDSSDESDESKDESESESEPELIIKDDEMDQDQLNETNEDDSDDSQEKQKKVGKASKSKKRKISEASPTQNGQLNGEEVKTEKRKKVEVNHVSAEDSEGTSDSEGESQDDDDDIDEEDSVDDSGDEQEVSSAGRTPMPNRKVVPGSALGESPVLPSTQKISLQKQQKNKLKAPDVSSTNKGTVPVTSKNARKLTGNVQIEDLKVGKGPVAKRGKLVFFHYVGKFHNGKVFEKCETPDDPFSFRLGQGEVIKGLEIGLEGMSVGGKRRITIPPHMGYGIKGVDEIPPNSTLVFTVELKAVK